MILKIRTIQNTNKNQHFKEILQFKYVTAIKMSSAEGK